MTHTLRYNVLLFFFLIIFSLTSAHRFLHTKPGENTLKLDDQSINYSGGNPLLDLQIVNSDSFNEVMGVEECGSGDEECLKRRVLAVADAHLDYIYTQHHKH